MHSISEDLIFVTFLCLHQINMNLIVGPAPTRYINVHPLNLCSTLLVR